MLNDEEIVNLIENAKNYQKNRWTPKEPKEFKNVWKFLGKHVWKPCWKLKFCPYGEYVEYFPLLPSTREHAVKHNKFLKEQLAKGAYKGVRKQIFEAEVANFDPNSHPEKISENLLEKECSYFGHLCPVFFVSELINEERITKNPTNEISFEIMRNVVRRDKYICQKCQKPLNDYELEFVHKISLSNSGKNEENNIELRCLECAQSK